MYKSCNTFLQLPDDGCGQQRAEQLLRLPLLSLVDVHLGVVHLREPRHRGGDVQGQQHADRDKARWG